MLGVKKAILNDWKIKSSNKEWTFHQLSPYIGKIKSSVANSLLKHFTQKGDVVYDPFCGAGTIPFEAWANDRVVIANDLNIYAYILTNAKLHPSVSIDGVFNKIKKYNKVVESTKQKIDLRKVPTWVRAFFHSNTLRETIAWCNILKKNEEYFLLACLMGILHHQRPGFLSYPSSHAVPYLRVKKFPKANFPHLYEYRNVLERLEKKVIRAFKRHPELNYKISRTCFNKDAVSFIPSGSVDAIITSPPYMRQLDYARDNRLRLWFLGVFEYKNLDKVISPSEKDFINSIKKSLITWNKILKQGGRCILILGDSQSKLYNMRLPELIEKIAVDELQYYKLELKFQSIIPEKRRVRKKYRGSERETVLVLKKK